MRGYVRDMWKDFYENPSSKILLFVKIQKDNTPAVIHYKIVEGSQVKSKLHRKDLEVRI